MKSYWFALVFIVNDACAGAVVSDLLTKFEGSESSIENCGSAVLLDGGSQLFCFELNDGSRLNITLKQDLFSDEQLTFYIVVFEGDTHKINWSSSEEMRLLKVMRSWLNGHYSDAEIEHLRWKLSSLESDPSATDPLTEDELSALLVADIPNLLTMRERSR